MFHSRHSVRVHTLWLSQEEYFARAFNHVRVSGVQVRTHIRFED